MKFLLFFVLLAVALAQPLEVSEKDLGEWETFKVKYMKQYDTEEEEAKRLKIFVDHLKFIREHNAKYENGETTFTVGVNKFTDLSTEEFVSSRNGYKRATIKRGRTFNMTSTGVTAASVDWRKKGAVTAIKDQGDCGSCWAFSTTGSLEGQHYITSGSLVSLSEQNLVDCSTENDGCDGGGMDDAFEYIMNNGGIDTESSYPYTGEDGSCKYKKKSKGATCTGYVDIAEGSETDLQTAVTNIGPISVAIDANPLHHYSSGIFASSNCSTTELNHGVLVVGYGVQNKKKYWLVKNSWGTDWGLSGYFMLAKNKNNMCGIASGACYPTV